MSFVSYREHKILLFDWIIVWGLFRWECCVHLLFPGYFCSSWRLLLVFTQIILVVQDFLISYCWWHSIYLYYLFELLMKKPSSSSVPLKIIQISVYGIYSKALLLIYRPTKVSSNLAIIMFAYDGADICPIAHLITCK